ncbi:MAG: methylenetetrahydrofolate--tRNA-(uracil(54)-C(5))-methyltransferase (FADH(2)-oxidizing) TrmFO [Bacillota bacterium]
MEREVHVIGGGLAGAEAAWQAARLGVRVVLYEMRPGTATPAHRTGDLAELVCSNSLGSAALDTASGVLKREMEILGGLLVRIAREHALPAGQALAVERDAFSEHVTRCILAHPLITVVRQEVREVPAERPLIIATGPLTSDALADSLSRLTKSRYLHFYDASSPIVDASSVDFSRAFWGSRYGKGGEDYLNCPMNSAEYRAFWEALVKAEQAPRHAFDTPAYFEGCLPVERIAMRGFHALRYGPLKPVGIVDPKTGRRPYAVLQLRREDSEGSMLNLVGCQTSLKWSEQRRVFRMVPALSRAEFLRYGVMHRNTYVCSPAVLSDTLEFSGNPGLFLAGQLTGVEGYMESAATGLLAGVNAARYALGEPLVRAEPGMMLHGLIRYITSADPVKFQPMNASFGLLPRVELKDRKERRKAMVLRALQSADKMVKIANLAIADRL